MASLIPRFRVNSNSGVLNNGNAFIIAPTSSTKTSSGSGGSLTGDFPSTVTVVNVTITCDSNMMNKQSRSFPALRRKA
ncbi:spore germination protein [Gordoniibacillus kamchatkensis]|uniref:spore germination protein n=1 Tax=Gordoniibacillus kamchatkensis TaxID=1590651 RepID=UPI000AF0AC0B